MNKLQYFGILLIGIGIFSFYWTLSHSPDAIVDTNSYNLSTPGYIFSLFISTAFVVLGLRRVFRKT